MSSVLSAGVRPSAEGDAGEPDIFRQRAKFDRRLARNGMPLGMSNQTVGETAFGVSIEAGNDHEQG
jgi:hypothetical protein